MFEFEVVLSVIGRISFQIDHRMYARGLKTLAISVFTSLDSHSKVCSLYFGSRLQRPLILLRSMNRGMALSVTSSAAPRARSARGEAFHPMMLLPRHLCCQLFLL